MVVAAHRSFCSCSMQTLGITWLQELWHTGSELGLTSLRAPAGFSSVALGLNICSLWALQCGLNSCVHWAGCPKSCAVFPDQALYLCLQFWTRQTIWANPLSTAFEGICQLFHLKGVGFPHCTYQKLLIWQEVCIDLLGFLWNQTLWWRPGGNSITLYTPDRNSY